MEDNILDNGLDINLLQEFPKDLLREYRLLPVRRMEDYIIVITDERPSLPVIDDLEVYSKYQVKIKLVTSSQIDKLINEYLEAPLETVEGMINDFDSASLDDYTDIELDSQIEDLEELAQEAPVIRLVNVIITTALKKDASDIHLEPFEEEIKVRYRIDGILYEDHTPPKSLFPAIVTRIKIMANLNIAERRLPQEGRIRIKVLGRELDIRVSIIPTLFGESVVLRLLDRAEVLLDLSNLGFEEKVLDKYKELINYSHGIILVTGPTGSGKTTTLYATLNYLNSSEKKIITIEDPIEYQLDGINQIQVKPEIDLTFAQGLRSILRQDPDIIMIGEIRDVETAKIAIQAALTGHLVFATLHTNDAVGAITRLLNMGVEDYLLAATVKGVMAQRLVRYLCSECKESFQSKELDLTEIDINPEEELYRPEGCDSCNQIGYRGRTGIYELLPISEELEVLITQGANTGKLQTAASKVRVKTLLEDGLSKVKKGVTTLEEVMRVTRVKGR